MISVCICQGSEQHSENGSKIEKIGNDAKLRPMGLLSFVYLFLVMVLNLKLPSEAFLPVNNGMAALKAQSNV